MWKQNGRPNGTPTRVASKTMTKAVLRVQASAEAQRVAARTQREEEAVAHAVHDYETNRALRQQLIARALRDHAAWVVTHRAQWAKGQQ